MEQTVTLVDDINPDGNSSPDWLTAYGDQLVFAAKSSAGIELYSTDGVSVEFVADINPDGDIVSKQLH